MRTTKAQLCELPFRGCLIRNNLTTWDCVYNIQQEYCTGPFCCVGHYYVFFFLSESEWKGVTSLKVAGLLLKDLLSQKSPFTASQPDCNRLRVRKHFVLSHWWSWDRLSTYNRERRGGFHSTGSTMLCAELCHIYLGEGIINCIQMFIRKVIAHRVQTAVFLCAALWIYCCRIFLLCGPWRLWRLFLLFNSCNQLWLMGALHKSITVKHIQSFNECCKWKCEETKRRLTWKLTQCLARLFTWAL